MQDETFFHGFANTQAHPRQRYSRNTAPQPMRWSSRRHGICQTRKCMVSLLLFDDVRKWLTFLWVLSWLKTHSISCPSIWHDILEFATSVTTTEVICAQRTTHTHISTKCQAFLYATKHQRTPKMGGSKIARFYSHPFWEVLWYIFEIGLLDI